MFAPACLARTLLKVSGPDAFGFLNALVTQEMALLEGAPVIYAGLLSPQGKVASDFFIWRDGADSFVIDAPPERGGDLLRRLTLYRLRAKAEIEDVSAASSVYVRFDRPDEEGWRADPRLGALGWRKLGPAGPASDARGYASWRIAQGVPDLAVDAAAEETFALEALFEELHGVAFDKGCFVGQENVSRMKRRATTRRKFCRLSVDDAQAGAAVTAGEAELGTVRAAIAGTALALIRLDRAMAARDLLRIGTSPAQLAPPDWLILPPTDEPPAAPTAENA